MIWQSIWYKNVEPTSLHPVYFFNINAFNIVGLYFEVRAIKIFSNIYFASGSYLNQQLSV